MDSRIPLRGPPLGDGFGIVSDASATESCGLDSARRALEGTRRRRFRAARSPAAFDLDWCTSIMVQLGYRLPPCLDEGGP